MKSFYLFLFLCTSFVSFSQSPNDAFMMKKKELCIALPYQYSAWDHYWEGSLYRDNPNLGTVSQQVMMPMVAYGILDRLNVIAALPYVKTKASAGTLRGEQGLQDLSIWVKGKVVSTKIGSKNNIDLMATLGYIQPVGGYYADYLPLSLGLGSQVFASRLMLNWWSNFGLFASANVGYDFRGNVEVDRSNYYTDRPYVTSEIRMPNMLNYGLTIGYFKNTTRIEAFYSVMDTEGNIDIRRNDMPMLSSNMDNSQVGFYVQQRMPFHKNFGITLNGAFTLSGRNVGKATTLGGGLVYQLNFSKQSKSAE